MADGTITYDYNVIEECLSMMSKKASDIQSQADELESDVKRIMVDWHGSTADAYNQLASDLDKDLVQNRQNLENLARALQNASENMQQQDSHGAAQIGR
ncbi:WXG100 family type VII secretion target [Amycolatopsis pigmentata]|uniref:ESAT-6-like protein n=1 Tax=Amycolatopsis pigmentata TaxID=450801 RepID=A0ABW5G1J2_9PSEU